MTAPATFVAVVGSNDVGWRVESPAKVLGAKVCLLSEKKARAAVLHPNRSSATPWFFRLHLPDGKIVEAHSKQKWKKLCEERVAYTHLEAIYPWVEGTLILTRPDLARATHARAMRQLGGIRTLAEVDDNYLCDPKHNIFMRIGNMGELAKLDHMKAMASMDGIIVTTDWLKNRYEQELRKTLDHCPEMFVCRNHVDLDAWPKPVPRETDRLRIGFMGSQQHHQDVQLIFDACRWAAYAGHKLTFIGLDPSHIIHPDKTVTLETKWHEFPYEVIPWTKPAEYRRNALPLDIMFAPILYNDNTAGKSDIKPIEALMSGAAPICQNVPLFNKTFRHGETALLAGSPAEFTRCLQGLCRSESLRQRIVHSGQQYIREERTMQKQGLAEWRAVL